MPAAMQASPQPITKRISVSLRMLVVQVVFGQFERLERIPRNAARVERGIDRLHEFTGLIFAAQTDQQFNTINEAHNTELVLGIEDSGPRNLGSWKDVKAFWIRVHGLVAVFSELAPLGLLFLFRSLDAPNIARPIMFLKIYLHKSRTHDAGKQLTIHFSFVSPSIRGPNPTKPYEHKRICSCPAAIYAFPAALKPTQTQFAAP